MRANMVPGALFPDYELTDHAGGRRRLSDLQGSDPMILLLSRGVYCPKDRRQAEGLVHRHREMEVGSSSSHRLSHRLLLTWHQSSHRKVASGLAGAVVLARYPARSSGFTRPFASAC
jgi:hypothetical protein